MRVRLAWLLLSAVGGLLFGFLLLPLVALLFSATAAELGRGLLDPRVRSALALSGITTTVSLGLIVSLGTPLAWVLAASERTPARWLEAVLKLPIVVPPAVSGIALLLAFGRRGYVSQLFGLDSGLAFTSAAVVLAEVFVAAPFYLQGAIAAFRNMDPGITLAARSVGAGPLRVLLKIALPIAGPSLLAAAATSWARALGEFGATLMFAGNMVGRTQTLPLAIYAALEADLHTAVALGVLLLGIAFGVLVGSHFLASIMLRRSNRRSTVRGSSRPSSTVRGSLEPRSTDLSSFRPSSTVRGSFLPSSAGLSARLEAPSATDRGSFLPSSAGLSARLEARVGTLALQVSLEVGAETLVVIGPNGSGKTSLLKVLLGALPLERGQLTISSRTLVDTERRLTLSVEERQIGYVPQDYGLFPHKSVVEHLEFALANAPRQKRLEPKARAQKIDSTLESLQLLTLASHLPSALSGGERQRLALARALVTQPSALLLDEPLAALDAIHRRSVRLFLADYLKTLTIPTLLVTHDPRDVEYFPSRVIVLEAGRIVQAGSWSELCEAPESRFVAEFTAAERSPTGAG